MVFLMFLLALGGGKTVKFVGLSGVLGGGLNSMVGGLNPPPLGLASDYRRHIQLLSLVQLEQIA